MLIFDQRGKSRFDLLSSHTVREAVADRETVTARVIAGEADGAHGPVEGIATQPIYLDVHMAPDAGVELPLTPGHNAFAYVYEGRAMLGPASRPQEASAGQLATLGDGDALRAVTTAAAARFLVLAARPLHEPIARYGPFVMNTREEIMKALQDFQSGKFGVIPGEHIPHT